MKNETKQKLKPTKLKILISLALFIPFLFISGTLSVPISLIGNMILSVILTPLASIIPHNAISVFLTLVPLIFFIVLLIIYWILVCQIEKYFIKNSLVTKMILITGVIIFFLLIGWPLTKIALRPLSTKCGETGGSAIGSEPTICQCAGIKLNPSFFERRFGSSSPIYCLGKCGQCEN